MNVNSNQEKKLTDHKINFIYFLKYLAIPIIATTTAITGVTGIFIGFITAIHWSTVVTGNTGYTGYIFTDMTTRMVLMTFLALLVYSALPFFSGYIAVTISNYKKIYKLNPKQHFFIAIPVVVIYSFLVYLIYNKLSNYWIGIILFILFLFWGSIYYYADCAKLFFPVHLHGNKKRYSYKRRKFIMCKTKLHSHKRRIVVMCNRIKRYPYKRCIAINKRCIVITCKKVIRSKLSIFVFLFYVAIGNIAGFLIILNYIMASSISHTTVSILSILAVSNIPILLTILGIIYASNEEYHISLIVAITFLAFLLITVDIPQNVIISLDHGIIKTPKSLKSAIMHESGTICNTMYTINHDGYTLFSCGENKDSWKGKIFYDKISSNYINTVSSNKKFIAKAYCFDSDIKKRLICVYRHTIVSRKVIALDLARGHIIRGSAIDHRVQQPLSNQRK